jgi:hypothetical protein
LQGWPLEQLLSLHGKKPRKEPMPTLWHPPRYHVASKFWMTMCAAAREAAFSASIHCDLLGRLWHMTAHGNPDSPEAFRKANGATTLTAQGCEPLVLGRGWQVQTLSPPKFWAPGLTAHIDDFAMRLIPYSLGNLASFNHQTCAHPKCILLLGMQQQTHTGRTGPKGGRYANSKKRTHT